MYTVLTSCYILKVQIQRSTDQPERILEGDRTFKSKALWEEVRSWRHVPAGDTETLSPTAGGRRGILSLLLLHGQHHQHQSSRAKQLQPKASEM